MRRTWTLLAFLALLGVVAWLIWSASGRGHPPLQLGSAAGAASPAEGAVTSEDGLWQGVARVGSIVGRHPEIVTFALTERASLRGTVHDEQGTPVAEAWIDAVVGVHAVGVVLE